MSQENGGENTPDEGIDVEPDYQDVSPDNETFEAFHLHQQRTVMLSNIWLNAMKVSPAEGEDIAVMDVVRHELKLALQDHTYLRCVKAFAIAAMTEHASDGCQIKPDKA